jgi:hypothetical protein
MISTSDQDAGPIGDPAGYAPVPAVKCTVEDALRVSRNLPLVSTDAAMAMLSFAVNRMLADNVRTAHAWGEFARTQSRTLLDATEKMHDGPMRDALAITARVHAALGEGVIAVANHWGRRYGHLAFALPVPNWRG